MFNVMVAGSMIASLLSPADSSQLLVVVPPPPASSIVIDVVTVNGSGCPAGTAAVAVSPDSKAFTVTYSNYLAQVGVGSTPTDFRKNCQLNLKVSVPSGFSYAIAQADYRGFASLAAGATATQRAGYYFQGMSQNALTSHSFKGALEDNWQTTDVVAIAALVFSPCGEQRNLNINTELRVSAGTSDTATTTSMMTMDSTDGSINTVYHFTWARCPA